MNKIQKLIAQCNSNNACAKGMRDLKADLSTQDAVALFFKYSDYVIEHNTPSLDLIREWKGSCEEFGVYVDDEISELRNQEKVVFNGECKAFLEYDGYSVAKIYVRHNSSVAINACDHAFISIDAMDNCNLVVAVAGNNAQVTVHKFGDAQVECIGTGIIVNNK